MRNLIGVIVLMFVVLLITIGIVYVRDNPDTFKGMTIFKPKNTPTPSVSLSPTLSVTNTPSIVVNPTLGSNPSLTLCQPSSYNQGCTQNPPSVCGYEKVVSANNTGIVIKRLYINSCYYCQFFGSAQNITIEGSTIYPLGYSTGACE